jgi:hypothetical protein
MKYEFHYGEDAIIDGVFYVTFDIIYTRVKLMFILPMMGIHTLCNPFLGVTIIVFHASL